FSRVLRERRRRASLPSRLLQQLVGLEAKLRQYEAGGRFIRAVEATGGPELLNRVWEGPEMLPTMDEIRHPETWVTRIGPARPPPGRWRRPKAPSTSYLTTAGSHPRAPRFFVRCRVVPIHWPCWHWPSRPGVSSPPSMSTTAYGRARRPKPKSWRRLRPGLVPGSGGGRAG